MTTNTDPKLPPRIRYCLVMNEYLQNDGFGYLKSKNSFNKETSSGRIELSVSFVTTANLIHGVQFYLHYVFCDIEMAFQRLFGKIWTDWTVHVQLGHVNRVLYEDSGYTDLSIGKAVNDFMYLIYPKVGALEERFETKEKLVAEYVAAPNEFVDFVPRLDRRVLMCLMLTKMFRASQYDMNVVKSEELIEKYKGSDKSEQVARIKRGISILSGVS